MTEEEGDKLNKLLEELAKEITERREHEMMANCYCPAPPRDDGKSRRDLFRELYDLEEDEKSPDEGEKEVDEKDS